jgi:DNA-directed RNA polymerase sigma subunit (sigma70/sigma32)
MLVETKELEPYLGLLDGREELVATLFYGFGGHKPHTLSAIAELVGVSPQRVHQIKNEGTRKLGAAWAKTEGICEHSQG